jgi:acyl-CoA thioester hydrolase
MTVEYPQLSLQSWCTQTSIIKGGQYMDAQSYNVKVLVKYLDTDTFGHVSAPVYYEYMLHAYLEFMHLIMAIPKAEKLPNIMLKTACEYYHPVKYGDVIDICARVLKIGKKSFDVEYLMSIEEENGKRQVARGQSTHVMYDYERSCSIDIPDSFKRQIEMYQST